MRPSLIAASALLALTLPASAETIKVPADHESIQAAVEAASDGDTIVVSKGTYLEAVEVTVPNLKLVGKQAVIDAGFSGPCIDIVGAAGVSISGFTLVNGTYGVRSGDPDITVTKCYIAGCSLVGLKLDNGPVTITSNTVRGCAQQGIFFDKGVAGHSVISRNVCELNGSSGIRFFGDDTEITRNRCEGNGLDGIHITTELVDGPPLPILVDRNDCLDNEQHGLRIANGVEAAMTITGNDCSDNLEDGMHVDAQGGLFEGNRCDGNGDGGMDLSLGDALVRKNTASRNQGTGIFVTGLVVLDGASFGTGDANTFEGNTANDNVGDGFLLDLGSGNVFTGNKAAGNGDDGLDIVSTGSLETVVDGNTFNGNGHEGLDNSGTGTAITNNTCRKNGRGVGPDIAGTGDGAQGTVAEFVGNHFDTGGDTAASRLDNFEATGP